eukprot:TRINITY_DN6147_c0_g1_i2.p1 TRINITY_DN6147_c0_g1~~TRINITY_DN6147_c0_g1_i2.p1  ORF type:complete len:328 (+),score=92.13 TRINITY_DN6147_c0_g1_i2:112-1095(+)
MLPSETMESTLAIKCKLSLDYTKECIASIKCELLKAAGTIQQEAEPEALEAASLAVKLNEMCLFMCDARNFGERKTVGRRQILEVSSVKVSMKTLMEFDRLAKTFGNSNAVAVEGKQVFLTVSYKDAINVANALIHNMKKIDSEYSACRESKDKLDITRIDSSGLDKGTFDPSLSYMHRQTSASLTRSPRHYGRESYLSSGKDNSIESVLKRMSEAVAHLKYALKDLSLYKNKAAESVKKSARLTKNLTQLKKQKTSAHLLEVRPGGGRLLEKPITISKKDDLTNSGSFRRSSVFPGTSNRDSRSMLEKRNSSTKVTFQSIKIVLSP